MMETMQYNRTFAVYKEVDVLIVGAGPAGIGAAICAARNGAKTLVIEQGGYVGGEATRGLVGPFMTSYDANNEEMVIQGIYKEIVDEMVKEGGAIDPATVTSENSYSGFYKIGHAHVGPFDRECFKKVSTRLIIESGAKILFHTSFIDVIMDGCRISGVVIANKSGISIVKAGIIIDCSGDADVAARAGVSYIIGNEETGNIQPATLFFRVYDVDTEALTAHIAEHSDKIRPFFGPFSWLIKEKAAEWGDIPRGEICLFESPTPGEYRLNVSRILDIDGTNAEDLTRAELIGMDQVYRIFDFLKKYAVGFENAKFMDTAEKVGVRESRHIDGLYKITKSDILKCLVPEDSIAVMATNMDTHNKSDSGGTYYTHTAGPYFGVSYKCLVPNKVSNLLVAGRPISADSVAGSAIRMIPCCIVFGQAAGTAAALLSKKEISPADVDVDELQNLLRSQGAFIPV